MGTPRSRPSSARRAAPGSLARHVPASPRPNGKKGSSDFEYTGGEDDAEGEEEDADGELDIDLEDEVEDVLDGQEDHIDAVGYGTSTASKQKQSRRSRSGRDHMANGHGPSPSPTVIRINGRTGTVPSSQSKGKGKQLFSPLGRNGSVNGGGKGKGLGKGKLPSGSVLSSALTAGSSEILHVAPTYNREYNCSFCGGTDERNKQGRKEKMNTCVQCGRSGHPSCLGMGEKLARKARSYAWSCMECKTCEVCNIKGDDERLMFCDGCDRGWHSYCVRPAMTKPPDDSWFCKTCKNDAATSSLPSHSKALSNPHSSRKGKERVNFDPSPTPSTIKKRGRPPKHLADSPFEPSPYDSHKRKDKRKREPDLDRGSLGASPAPPKVRVKLRLSVNKAREMELQEEEEEEKVPFGGVITGEDADMAKTNVTDKDKVAFDKALQAAETSLGAALGAESANARAAPVYVDRGSPAPSSLLDSQFQSFAGPSRTLRNHLLSQPSFNSTPLDSPSSAHGSPGPQGPPAALLASNQHKIKHIRFGKYDIDTWYNAPYPEEYQSVPDGRLWLCEFCLKYMKSGFVAQRHRLKCKVQHPPGDEIYRAPIPDSPTGATVSVFEVDGRKNKIYCQNLCLLAKMFLDHKTLYYDVEPFLFYVMTEVDDVGARFVGYFSKEKRSQDNNVSCIMTLPVRQRKGWGQLLIDFSYALSQKEGRVGGPERPLSGLGEVTYKRYWLLTVFRYLATRSEGDKITLDEISGATSMTVADVFATLKEQDMITAHDTPPPSYSTPSRPWRGRGRGRGRPSLHRKQAPAANGSAPNEIAPNADDSEDVPNIKIPRRYSIQYDRAYVEAVLRTHDHKGYLRLQSERLKYHPFLVSRAQGTQRPGLLAKATLMGGGGAAIAQAKATGQVHSNGAGDGEREETSSASMSREVTTPAPPDLDGRADAMDVDGQGEGDGELVERGQDKATLELVARLSGSPKRALRTRGSVSRAGTLDRSVEGIPRRSRRGGVAADAGGMGRNGAGHAGGRNGRYQEEEEEDEEDEIGGTPKTPAVPGRERARKVAVNGALDYEAEGQGTKEDGQTRHQEKEEEEEDAAGEEEDAEGEEEDADGEEE